MQAWISISITRRNAQQDVGGNVARSERLSVPEPDAPTQ